jgi:hypothetical protein
MGQLLSVAGFLFTGQLRVCYAPEISCSLCGQLMQGLRRVCKHECGRQYCSDKCKEADADRHECLKPHQRCSVCHQWLSPFAPFMICDNDCGQVYCGSVCADLDQGHGCGRAVCDTCPGQRFVSVAQISCSLCGQLLQRLRFVCEHECGRQYCSDKCKEADAGRHDCSRSS